jgi:hypothetical protein
MNNYILYYYLREDFSSPFYVGYGRPRRINSRHSRRNGAEILPPRERRWIVKSGLSKEEAIELEIKHIALWKRECDGGVLLNQNLGGEGKPGGQKTKGFSGRKHTEETKRKISEKVAGENNPSYGVPCSEERKKKISEKAKERFTNGFVSPAAKIWKLTSPKNDEYIIAGCLKQFCKLKNISYATMSAAIRYNRTGPRRNGWSIEELINTNKNDSQNHQFRSRI